jgi:hypothetical protein
MSRRPNRRLVWRRRAGSSRRIAVLQSSRVPLRPTMTLSDGLLRFWSKDNGLESFIAIGCD